MCFMCLYVAWLLLMPASLLHPPLLISCCAQCSSAGREYSASPASHRMLDATLDVAHVDGDMSV